MSTFIPLKMNMNFVFQVHPLRPKAPHGIAKTILEVERVVDPASNNLNLKVVEGVEAVVVLVSATLAVVFA